MDKRYCYKLKTRSKLKLYYNLIEKFVNTFLHMFVIVETGKGKGW